MKSYIGLIETCVVVIAVLFLLAWGAWETHENKALRIAVSSYQAAQQTNLATIAGLVQSAKDTQAQLQVSRKAASEAASEAKTSGVKADTAETTRDQKRQVTYEKNPAAKQWHDTVVPDAVLDGLCRGACGQDAVSR